VLLKIHEEGQDNNNVSYTNDVDDTSMFNQTVQSRNAAVPIGVKGVKQMSQSLFTKEFLNTTQQS
jgi:hypothetical protein